MLKQSLCDKLERSDVEISDLHLNLEELISTICSKEENTNNVGIIDDNEISTSREIIMNYMSRMKLEYPNFIYYFALDDKTYYNPSAFYTRKISSNFDIMLLVLQGLCLYSEIDKRIEFIPQFNIIKHDVSIEYRLYNKEHRDEYLVIKSKYILIISDFTDHIIRSEARDNIIYYLKYLKSLVSFILSITDIGEFEVYKLFEKEQNDPDTPMFISSLVQRTETIEEYKSLIRAYSIKQGSYSNERVSRIIDTLIYKLKNHMLHDITSVYNIDAPFSNIDHQQHLYLESIISKNKLDRILSKMDHDFKNTPLSDNYIAKSIFESGLFELLLNKTELKLNINNIIKLISSITKSKMSSIYSKLADTKYENIGVSKIILLKGPLSNRYKILIKSKNATIFSYTFIINKDEIDTIIYEYISKYSEDKYIGEDLEATEAYEGKIESFKFGNIKHIITNLFGKSELDLRENDPIFDIINNVYTSLLEQMASDEIISKYESLDIVRQYIADEKRFSGVENIGVESSGVEGTKTLERHEQQEIQQTSDESIPEKLVFIKVNEFISKFVTVIEGSDLNARDRLYDEYVTMLKNEVRERILDTKQYQIDVGSFMNLYVVSELCGGYYYCTREIGNIDRETMNDIANYLNKYIKGKMPTYLDSEKYMLFFVYRMLLDVRIDTYNYSIIATELLNLRYGGLISNILIIIFEFLEVGDRKLDAKLLPKSVTFLDSEHETKHYITYINTILGIIEERKYENERIINIVLKCIDIMAKISKRDKYNDMIQPFIDKLLSMQNLVSNSKISKKISEFYQYD